MYTPFNGLLMVCEITTVFVPSHELQEDRHFLSVDRQNLAIFAKLPVLLGNGKESFSVSLGIVHENGLQSGIFRSVNSSQKSPGIPKKS